MSQSFEAQAAIELAIDRNQERILDLVKNNSDVIHKSIALKYGITSWFKEYIKSEEFSKLNKEEKGEAFDTYDMLFFTLSSIEELCF